MNYICPFCKKCSNFDSAKSDPYADIWRCINREHNCIIYQDKFWRFEYVEINTVIYYEPLVNQVFIKLNNKEIFNISGNFELKDAIIILNKYQQLKVFYELPLL